MDFLRPYQTTALFLSICALLCLFSLVLLNQDLRLGGEDSQLSQGGKVLFSNSIVKRKNQKSLLWNPLTENNHLFIRDSILVGPKSSTTFELDNGEKIEIGEDSFFVFEPAKTLEEQLKRGALVVSDKGTRTLLESQADGTIKKKKLSVTLISPDNGAQIVFTEGIKTPVHLETETIGEINKDSPIKLQIGFNKKFIGEILEPNLSTIDLPVGTYYWRITDGTDSISETRSFTVFKLAPIALLTPPPSENILRIDYNLPIRFGWKPLKKSPLKLRDDKLQIAEDKEFKKIYSENIISPLTGTTEVKILRSGTYFWRVLSSISKEKSLSSEIRSFHLSQADNLKIALKEPLDNTVLRTNDSVSFQWEDSHIDAEYILEVTDFASKKPVFTQSTRGDRVTWKKPIFGSFLWRVIAKNALRTVATSEWSVLTLLNCSALKTLSPLVDDSKLFWDIAPQFDFAWERETLAKSYSIEFSDSNLFSRILYSHTLANNSLSSQNMKLPLGTMFWRVRALDSEQLTINMSNTSRLVFDHPPVLRAPSSFDPPDGTNWDVIKEGKDLIIHWGSVPEAKRYDVTISGSSTKSFNTQVERPELILKRYKSGKYTISVSAVDVLGRIGEKLGPIHLNLQYSVLVAPSVEDPEVK